MSNRAATRLTIADMMRNPRLLGASFAGPSWDRWEAVLRAAYAEPMSDVQVKAFREVAERAPPKDRVKELVVIAGRGAGKDSVASAIATHAAASFDPKGKLRPGEQAVVMCLACDREQAGIVFGYIRAYFEQVPALAKMVVAINSESIELNNNVVVEVHTSNYRSVRGRSLLCAVLDEVALWRSDSTANPDSEIHAAITPGLARVPNSMLVMISTAHRRAGLLWNRFKDHYGKNTDTLVVKAATLQLNPTFDGETIRAALESDPQLYGAEYNSEWRSDLQAFVSREAVEACVIEGRYELAPASGIQYQAFVDPSGGSSDSMTLAIGHKQFQDKKVILDLVREWRPPFSPEAVVTECADLLKMYGVRNVVGDRFGGEFVREPFIRRGISYSLAAKPKKDLYQHTLPLFNSKRVELLDIPKLVSQFASLERRTARGTGADVIDHPRAGHDDVANCVAGCIDIASWRNYNPPKFGIWGSASDKPKHKWDGPDGMGGYAVSR